jgi:hypothetical protein
MFINQEGMRAMRPNLSLESIAGALAVLGTGVIMAACGGEPPKSPVNATDVPASTDKAAGDAANAAGHCGAGKDHKAGEASCSADKKGAADAKPADPVTTAAKPADTTAAPATPADAKPADAKPADAKAATPATTGTGKKPAAPATPAAAKKGGSGSCGAGTCSAKK